MNAVKTAIKLTTQCGWVSIFLIYSLCGIFLIRNKKIRKKFHAKTAKFFCRYCYKILGIKLTVKNPPSKDTNYLLVANHTGFIDIFCLASIANGLFVTSLDMRKTPVLGQITDMGGCLYVNRKNRNNIHQEILVIRDALKEGFNVVLYPEAAAMSGEKIYPFKKTLLTAAAGTGVPILPVVINFHKVNNEPMSHKWREHMFWWGDKSFLTCVWKAHSVKSAEIEIEFLEPIFCNTEAERHEVALNAQRQIEAKYVRVTMPL